MAADPGRVLADAAYPIEFADSDYDPLLDMVGDAHFVLLGEATHGTQEFYRERARITRRLIVEKGFNGVAVEADWPDADRVHRYVTSASADTSAVQSLGDFRRFPTWMWRNTEIVEFVEWLRGHNEQRAGSPMTGFYGLDLYSLHGSMDAVLAYLKKVDRDAFDRARQRYACFDHFGENTQAYGHVAGFDLAASCRNEVLQQLVDLRSQAMSYVSRGGRQSRDDFFSAEQNARLVKNAEEYYRSMFAGRVESWNKRDGHMAETLDALASHLKARDGRAKIVVWEHNSHLGDARATEAGQRGELNVGQLVRQQHGADAFLVGFTTYQGTVTAASDWDGPSETMRVQPALAGSFEKLFHETKLPGFLLELREVTTARALQLPRLERAIGVIYRPGTERLSHYFHAKLPDQFDAVLHFDVTQAVTPLEMQPGRADEIPETFPTGM